VAVREQSFSLPSDSIFDEKYGTDEPIVNLLRPSACLEAIFVAGRAAVRIVYLRAMGRASTRPDRRAMAVPGR